MKILITCDSVGLSLVIYQVETKHRRTALNVPVPAMQQNTCHNNVNCTLTVQ